MVLYDCGVCRCIFFKTVSRRLLDTMLGFAAGVMIAASFWSLLAPSIEYAESSYGNLAWIPAAVGFAAGGIFTLGRCLGSAFAFGK